MTRPSTPLERLIDALQAALLNAREMERNAHDHVEACTQLRAALNRAGEHVQHLRPSDDRGSECAR